MKWIASLLQLKMQCKVLYRRESKWPSSIRQPSKSNSRLVSSNWLETLKNGCKQNRIDVVNFRSFFSNVLTLLGMANKMIFHPNRKWNNWPWWWEVRVACIQWKLNRQYQNKLAAKFVQFFCSIHRTCPLKLSSMSLLEEINYLFCISKSNSSSIND